MSLPVRFWSFIRKVYSLIFAGLLVVTSTGWAQDDFQTRELMTLKFIDTQKIDVLLFYQQRTENNAKEFSFSQVSPQLKMDFWKNLSLGLNYSYINVKIGDEFKFHHRLELEANPHW